MSHRESRRAFGQRLLQAAAGLGLQGVGASLLVSPSTGSAAVPVHSVRVLVIGTGYGGAVSALRLAQKGVEVTMLEMGRLWNTPGTDGNVFCPLLSPDGRAMWLRDKTKAVVSTFIGFPTSLSIPRSTGVLDVLEFPGIDVYCGRGVGGGSLVNQAMTVTPQREALRDVMPVGVDLDALYATYYPRARAMLGSNAIRPAYFESSAYYQYARVARASAARAGYTTDLIPAAYSYSYMEQEEAGLVPKSALAREATYGNNHGKGSLDKNYIADAVATGRVTVLALHQVKSISVQSNGRYLVTVDQIDTSGNLVARKAFDAEHLFVSAGSIGSSQLLVRARETGGLPALNAAVGTGWNSNGDIFSARANQIWDPVGTDQSMITTGAFNARDKDNKLLFSMTLPLPVPYIETWVSMSVTMTSSPERSTFTYNPATDAVTLDWSTRNAAAAVASTRYVHDRINRANGTGYRVDLFGGKTFADTSTYHPIGGIPLGQATDLYGRLNGYRKLYATDGSLLPGPLCANPLLTITAMAERNIERVIAEDFGL